MYSEAAIDFQRSLSFLGGVVYEPFDQFTIAVSGRRYARDFQSIHGNAFGESQAHIGNESGVYTGIRWKILKPLAISAYVDRYSFPYPSSTLKTPANGSDYLLSVYYQAARHHEISFRLRNKLSPVSTAQCDEFGRDYDRVSMRNQKYYRVTNKVEYSREAQLMTKVGWMSVQYPGQGAAESGFFLSQALAYWISPSFNLQTQCTIFDTDSYDARIYDFENDLPGSYASPALFGKGIRWYVMLKYDLLAKTYLAIRYSATAKYGEKCLGSGLDEIEGNRQSTISSQIAIQF